MKAIDPARSLQVFGILAVLLGLATACAQTTPNNGRRIDWLSKPWELRYVFYVTADWPLEALTLQRRVANAGPGKLRREWDELFVPTSFHQSREKWAKPGDGLSVVLIEFGRDGKVVSPHRAESALHGRIDDLLYVTLTPGDRMTQRRYPLGEWFTGLGDVSTHWAPGLCDVNAMPSPFSDTDTGYLYGPKFNALPPTPTFGCREWAYQLDDPGRPYIDITSYYSKKADPDGPGSYVYKTMGWARFSDAPKPVIGKHEADWFCLHECPAGAAPGLIPDIKAWAAQQGWPVPKRPTRSPMFPDPPARPGTYPR